MAKLPITSIVVEWLHRRSKQLIPRHRLSTPRRGYSFYFALSEDTLFEDRSTREAVATKIAYNCKQSGIPSGAFSVYLTSPRQDPIFPVDRCWLVGVKARRGLFGTVRFNG